MAKKTLAERIAELTARQERATKLAQAKADLDKAKKTLASLRKKK